MVGATMCNWGRRERCDVLNVLGQGETLCTQGALVLQPRLAVLVNPPAV